MFSLVRLPQTGAPADLVCAELQILDAPVFVSDPIGARDYVTRYRTGLPCRRNPQRGNYFASMMKVGAMPAELEKPLPPET